MKWVICELLSISGFGNIWYLPEIGRMVPAQVNGKCNFF